MSEFGNGTLIQDSLTEGIPSNEVLLLHAAESHDRFYKDVFKLIESIPEEEIRKSVERRGYVYTPIKR